MEKLNKKSDELHQTMHKKFSELAHEVPYSDLVDILYDHMMIEKFDDLNGELSDELLTHVFLYQ